MAKPRKYKTTRNNARELLHRAEVFYRSQQHPGELSWSALSQMQRWLWVGKFIYVEAGLDD